MGLAAGGVVMLPLLESFGITPMVSIGVSTTTIQFWFLAFGGLLIVHALRAS